MKITYDPGKDAVNIAKHGISLAESWHFDWRMAEIREDKRQDYGERRYIAEGYINPRLYIMIFTLRRAVTRIISLRKANKRERKGYEQKRKI